MREDVGRQLPNLVELAEAGDDQAVRRALLGWSPAELVSAMDQGRRRYGATGVGRVDGCGMGVSWLLAISWDGRCREASVVRMTTDRSPLADRMLALMLSDHVEQVRRRAWRAVEQRLDPNRAAHTLPVLVALRSRQRGRQALDGYRDLVAERLAVEPWRLGWLSDDLPTRRWAAEEWLATGPTLTEVVERLETETEQYVASTFIRHVSQQANAADSSLLLASRHGRLRADGAWLSTDPSVLEPLLGDRSALVRRAAQSRLAAQGFDVVGWNERNWSQSRTPRALRGAIEAGVEFPVDDLLDLAEGDDPAISAVAVAALGARRPQPAQVARIVSLLDRPRLAGPAAAALRQIPGWSFDELAPRWRDAGTADRRRLAPLLSSRGGWDRVRAALLAAADGDPWLRDFGLRNLGEALSLQRDPSPQQRDQLADLLAASELAGDRVRTLQERLDLPVAPYRGSVDDGWNDADAAVLLALSRSGRMLRPSLGPVAVLRSAGFALGRRISRESLDAIVERLVGVGLVIPPRAEDYALTADGRALVKGLRPHAPGALEIARMRLDAVEAPA